MELVVELQRPHLRDGHPVGVARVSINALPPELVSLMRVLYLATDEGCGFGKLDVERVEATWEFLEADSTAQASSCR